MSLDWERFLWSMIVSGFIKISLSVSEGMQPPEFMNSYIATTLSRFYTSSGVPVPKTKGPGPDDQSPRFTIAYSRRRTLSLIDRVTWTFVFDPRTIASDSKALFSSMSWRVSPFAWEVYCWKPDSCFSVLTCASQRRIDDLAAPTRTVGVFIAARVLDDALAARSARRSVTSAFIFVAMAWCPAWSTNIPKFGKSTKYKLLYCSRKVQWLMLLYIRRHIHVILIQSTIPCDRE